MSEMLTAKEVSEKLGLARTAIYELVAAGRLACYKIGVNGGRLRFKASDLEASRVGPKVKVDHPPKPPRRVPYVSKYDHGY
jgi:excisionase family DNA binding protein